MMNSIKASRQILITVFSITVGIITVSMRANITMEGIHILGSYKIPINGHMVTDHHIIKGILQ